MSFDPLQNFVYGQVSTAPSPASSGTSLVLQSGQGSRFPDPATVGAYNAVVKPSGYVPIPDNAEVIRITAKSSDTLTIQREQEGSSARTIVVGDEVYGMAVTAKMIRDIQEATQVSLVTRETPTGTINGSNTAFTLADTPSSGSERVYLNGVLQNQGASNDYTISGNTITFITAPLTGDILLVDYSLSASTFVTPSESFVINELVNQTPNGSTTVFTVDNAFISGSEQVYRDGQLLRGGGEDYTATPGTGTITFVTAPVTNSVILVTYRKNNVSGSGDADTLDGYHASDLISGWIPTGETWTYSAWDDTNGVSTATITVPSNATTKYQPGMRVRFSQTTDGTKYGIITKVTSTTLTVFINTDYDFDNEAITNPFYSSLYDPFGFSLDKDKYSVTKTDTSNVSQSSITTNTWYNVGSLSIDIPVGEWDTQYLVVVSTAPSGGGGSGNHSVYTTLSTGSSSESDVGFSVYDFENSGRIISTLARNKKITVSSKTTYYLNAQSPGATPSLSFRGDVLQTMIKSTLAYL